MVQKTLIIAPHPDDELLGCGGMLLRRAHEGAQIGWLIVTGISKEYGWTSEQVQARESEIQQVSSGLGVLPEHLYQLGFPTARLDTVPLGDIVAGISKPCHDFQPEEILVPYRGDAHTDHRIVFDAACACTKWFRYPFVKRVLAYETLSETEFGLTPNQKFNPNVYMDISHWFDRKIELFNIYSSEIGDFPFPRSLETITALAKLRGSLSGFNVAEAFELLLERS